MDLPPCAQNSRVGKIKDVHSIFPAENVPATELPMCKDCSHTAQKVIKCLKV